MGAWLILAACGPKAPAASTGPGTPTPTPAATPTAKPEHLGAEAVIWSVEKTDIEPQKVQSREGTLKRTPPPPESGDNQTSYWPWKIDYWGIMRTDLEELLKPYLGRNVRVEGEYRKIYAHDGWIYEVDPVKIVLLPTP